MAMRVAKTAAEAIEIWATEPTAVLRLEQASGTSVDTGKMREDEVRAWFGEPMPATD